MLRREYRLVFYVTGNKEILHKMVLSLRSEISVLPSNDPIKPNCYAAKQASSTTLRLASPRTETRRCLGRNIFMKIEVSREGEKEKQKIGGNESYWFREKKSEDVTEDDIEWTTPPRYLTSRIFSLQKSNLSVSIGLQTPPHTLYLVCKVGDYNFYNSFSSQLESYLRQTKCSKIESVLIRRVAA